MKSRQLLVFAFLLSFVILFTPRLALAQAQSALTLKEETPAPAPSPLSYAVAYDLKSKSWTPIAAYRITTFVDFAGKKGFNLDLCGVAGLDLESTQPLAGIALFWNRPFAKNLDIGLGFGATVQANRPTGAFVAITAVVRF